LPASECGLSRTGSGVSAEDQKGAPGHKHWNGATATTAMTHSAIVDAPDGRAVEWMEKVTDEQYFASAKTN